nr:hypothetical protein CFP56_08124 [Quercus suber]
MFPPSASRSPRIPQSHCPSPSGPISVHTSLGSPVHHRAALYVPFGKGGVASAVLARAQYKYPRFPYPSLPRFWPRSIDISCPHTLAIIRSSPSFIIIPASCSPPACPCPPRINPTGTVSRIGRGRRLGGNGRSRSTLRRGRARNLTSAIVTICVGPSQRLFAAHEDVLTKSQHFAHACRSQFFESSGKRIDLPQEEPEVFSAVLEYLYKGDYSPKLIYDKKRASWLLDDADGPSNENTIHSNGVGGSVLKDTMIYVCPSSLLPPRFRLMLVTDSTASAPLTATHSRICSASRSRNKACSPAFNAAPSFPRRASLTPTPHPATRSYELTTSRSSSAAAIHSSVAARCRWRWRPAAVPCSLTCSSPW